MGSAAPLGADFGYFGYVKGLTKGGGSGKFAKVPLCEPMAT